jgi:hypothetical protein
MLQLLWRQPGALLLAVPASGCWGFPIGCVQLLLLLLVVAWLLLLLV